MESSRLNPYLGLAGWLLVVFAVAACGARASVEAGTFYADLARPAWAPPAWLFGPVWTTLYALMGIAAWRVWRTHGFRHARGALFLFLLQLGVNGLWTWLFFVWHAGALAFAEIIVLWMLIAATIASFWHLGERVASALLLPYLAWVSFAAALAFSLWRLNPAVLG